MQPALVADDLVVCLRASRVRQGVAVADLDRLHRLDPHHRRREPRIEPVLLGRVGAKARRDAGGHDLYDPAQRVSVLAGSVHRCFVSAGQRHRVPGHGNSDLP